jgi:hypothetical protein
VKLTVVLGWDVFVRQRYCNSPENVSEVFGSLLVNLLVGVRSVSGGFGIQLKIFSESISSF